MARMRIGLFRFGCPESRGRRAFLVCRQAVSSVKPDECRGKVDAGEDKQYQSVVAGDSGLCMICAFRRAFRSGGASCRGRGRGRSRAVSVRLRFGGMTPVFPALASGSRTRCMGIVSPIGNDRIRVRLREQNSLPVGIS